MDCRVPKESAVVTDSARETDLGEQFMARACQSKKGKKDIVQKPKKGQSGTTRGQQLLRKKGNRGRKEAGRKTCDESGYGRIVFDYGYQKH